jgi:hypothetical protein
MAHVKRNQRSHDVGVVPTGIPRWCRGLLLVSNDDTFYHKVEGYRLLDFSSFSDILKSYYTRPESPFSIVQIAIYDSDFTRVCIRL